MDPLSEECGKFWTMVVRGGIAPLGRLPVFYLKAIGFTDRRRGPLPSEWEGSNLRHPAPKAGALPLRYTRSSCS